VSDLWIVSRESAEARCITDGTLEIESFAWSPDGSEVMLVAGKDMFIEGVCNSYLYLVSRGGGDVRAMTNEIDKDATIGAAGAFGLPGPYIPQWSSDGARVYFLFTDHGCIDVYCLDVRDKVVTRLSSGEHLIYFLALLPTEQGVLLALEQPLHPWELYLLPLNASQTGELERLTHLHDQQLTEFVWSKPERIRFTAILMGVRAMDRLLCARLWVTGVDGIIKTSCAVWMIVSHGG
jgi:dipeptidyl aminopeptidase/acylaminoacyl peptidase